MPITIESPTAEAALEALQKLPSAEMERLRQLLEIAPAVNESDEWSEEDIEDFRRSTNRLIEKRLGPEACDYD